MSQTGATLSGSYSGASASPTAAGFKWGTVSGSLNQTASCSASGTSGSLSATLSGLSAGKTYFYQAFVTVSGTGDYASQSQTFYGTECSFKTKAVATASVTTSAANPVGSNSATLNGSFSGASGRVYETGFYWGTSSGSMTNQVTTDGTNNTSGSFSYQLSGLSASTIYYYRAYVLEYNEATGSYEERVASSYKTFTTTAAQTFGDQEYLSGYGIPALSSLNPTLRGHADQRTSWDDYWYSYSTSNSNRQIAVHTFLHPDTNEETCNYVTLYDGSRYAPVWTAHTMNSTYWPDTGISRPSNDPWTTDPAISLVQFDGLDDNSQYSRGHFVASNYRKTTTGQNKQTFYYTNKAPQWQDGFNSGVWSTLEERVVTMTPSGTTMLYVVTGVLYEGTLTYKSKTVGSKTYNVPLPSHFYKCIMRCTFSGGAVIGAQGIAFVYTNASHSGDKYYKAEYVTTIDAIETRAGFDFFPNVPAAYQNTAESNPNHTWFTGQSN